MVILAEIELKNFKTFIGDHKVTFKEGFTVITGPNGAGKSNFMDAIAFAMGAKPADLRVSRIDELSHASVPKSYRMFVKLILRSTNGEEHCFKRSFMESNCCYTINDNEISFRDYKETLKKLNFHTRIQNFFVYQDRIEAIVTMKPAERTNIFEEMSGSANFKAEYDDLKEKLLQLESEHQNLISDKRNLVKETKAMQFHRKKAGEYAQLIKEHETARMSLLLLDLYRVRRSLKNHSSEEEKLRERIDELAIKKYEKESKLRKFTKERETIESDATRIEKTREEPLKREITRIKRELAEIGAEKLYFEKGLATGERSYESARKADDSRKSDIRDLENALETIEREMNKYVKRYSKTLGRDVELSSFEIKEYDRLKLSSGAACATDNDRLFVLDCEYKSFRDIYEMARTRLKETEIAINRKRSWRDSIVGRIERIEDQARKLQARLEIERVSLDESTRILEKSRHEAPELKEEIDSIDEELGDRSDEFVWMKKNEEIVQQLRNHFSGVYNTLGHLCEPIHSRYSIAVTKALRRNVDAIVIADGKTARDCIKYLKENRIGIMKFLPLDQLRECRLSEHLRDIKDPPNVKLVYDVIKFSPPEIAAAVFYATENTLVCETPEDASELSLKMLQRHDCVSLDGCCYHKSGLISGGNSDLARKARRWDMQKKECLKERKKILTAKMREIIEATPNESDLSDAAIKIAHIELSLKLSMSDKTAAYKELSEIENELRPLEEKIESLQGNVSEAKSNMDRAYEAMNDLKSKIAAKETKIFEEFCARIGFENIHEYENGKRAYEERIREIDEQIDRIKAQLSYDRSVDTAKNVERWEKNVSKMKKRLESIVEREIDAKKLLNENLRKLETVEREHRESLELLGETEKKIHHLREKIASLAKQHKSLSAELISIQNEMDSERANFHALLTESKIKGFSIVSKNADETADLSRTRTDDASAETDAAVSWLSVLYEQEANLEIDFSRLPEELRVLEDTELVEARTKIEKAANDLRREIDENGNPDTTASQRLSHAKDKLAETERQIQKNQRSMKNIRDAFDIVKKNRSDRFVKFFERMTTRVDKIYKQLTRNQAAQAYLIAENPEEPYLSGIRYDCVVPGKGFQSTANLSGGEKTMAALPLLFAMQSIDDKQPSFMLVDEIDVALDHGNITKVVKYMQRNKDNQSIVISHKKEFIAGADRIIGITSTGSGTRMESTIIALDLSPFSAGKSRS